MDYKNPNLAIDQRVEDLLQRMTLKEKISQLGQTPMQDYRDRREEYLQDVREGRYGSRILADTAWAGNAPGESVDPKQINEIQRTAVEESRLGIPLIVARDVIYGQETVLPIPLAQAASFNPKLAQEAYRCVAREAASLGINWTFSPMMDVARDPRWGRVIETSGEDPYLTSRMIEGAVKGFQGDDLSDSESLVACAKHFCGYAGSEGGRDYDATDFSENTLHNLILPPFKTAVEAGVETFMSGFNDLGGTPVSGSKDLIQGWLKDEQGFEGFVVSDWGSIADLAYFGFAKDEEEAAEKAMNAGVDMAMTYEHYEDHIQKLLDEGRVSEERLNDAVRRILTIKFKAGLFENPYVDEDLNQKVLRRADHVEKALELASQSLVLLKNKNKTLPIEKKDLKLAVIGPHAHSKRQHLGSWCLDGKSEDVSSIYEGIQLAAPDLELFTEDAAFCDEMVEAAHRADVVVLCVGESHRRTGEARNVAELTLPAGQEEMIAEIGKVGKALIVVQCTGRPLPSPAIEQYADALVYAWQSGTEAGHAVAKILFGDVNPSGKLPMTVPRSTGQIPIYYNKKQIGKMRDYQEYQPYKNEQATPLYTFGYGLSYSSFEYSNLQLSSRKISQSEVLEVSVDLSNTSEVSGTELVQLYIRDLAASRVRPLRELKGFQRVDLKPGERKQVKFNLTSKDLEFYGADSCFKAEPGEFEVYVGGSSEANLMKSFHLVD